MTAKSVPQEVLRGVEVAVGASRSDSLLGVREGFVRYFHRVLDRPVPVAVVPQEVEDVADGLASGDSEMIERCAERARELESRLGDAYHFYIGVEEGLEVVASESGPRHYVRTWSVVRGFGSQASGASGSFEVPGRMLEEGSVGPGRRRAPVGLRRGQGLVSALSGGLESRRSAVATAVFNAVSSLFFDVYSGHPKSGASS